MNSNQTIAVTLAVASTGGSWNRYGKEEPRDPFEARPEKYRKAAERRSGRFCRLTILDQRQEWRGSIAANIYQYLSYDRFVGDSTTR